jgi:hypothetical protein
MPDWSGYRDPEIEPPSNLITKVEPVGQGTHEPPALPEPALFSFKIKRQNR